MNDLQKLTIVCLAGAIFFSSCEKDLSCDRCTENNKPPVAAAGPDQLITLPLDSVVLDGTASSDPNGSISSFEWTKISGPASFSFVNAAAAKTVVKNLVSGYYQFELKVTDAGGLFNKDTVQVIVTPDILATIQWQKVLGGARADVAQSIQPTADGGFIVAGNTNSQDGDITGYHSGTFGCYQNCFSQSICGYYPDGLVVKLNSTGAIQWQKALGGTAAENLLSIQPTADGGYIASGLTYSNDGDVSGFHGGDEADAWVVKLSSTGTIQWQKVLGGSTGCDFANAVLPTPDGGYIFVGHTDSYDGDVTTIAGERDVWLVKLNSTGAIQWQKTLGGTESDYAYSFQSTPDGGYIAAGYTYSNNGDVSGNHGGSDAWVVKLNNSGVIQWQKALGGSSEEIARSVQSTSDGGYIVAGSTKSNDGDVSGFHGGDEADAWVVKLSSTGTIQWQKALGGSSEEIARSITPTTDGSYLLTGSTKSNNGDVTGTRGAQDVWIVKLSSTGTFLWQKPLGGTANDFANSIQLTTDGGYIVAGQAASNNGDVSGYRGDTDAWVIKLKL
ncbi:MAG: PKD domain-containing protein [Bacteroidota bacterium]|nr:PKD domain-containing protein [Bacteroidota bacterium]